MLISLLLGTAVLAAPSPARAQNDDGRGWSSTLDFDLKAGTDRSLGSLNLMTPLAQTHDSMILLDLRSVISDQSTWEGNAGLGYRRITPVAGHDVIFGGYGFYDRRRTQSGNSFGQATIGVEAIGTNWDGRANAYIPTGDKTKLTLDGEASAALSGTQIYVQDGRRYESSMKGYDVELGHALPDLDRVRVYGAYYNFSGKDVTGINGFRLRMAADVNDWLRIGVEHQTGDRVREPSSFAEARIRIPLERFSRARRAALDAAPPMAPIRARMMEPIVRDIDIVTQAKAPAAPTAALGADGSAPARIYFVDNTAAAGGDGSQAHPFNTLAAAQAAATNNYDTIYLARGDGSTTGQAAGITLSHTGQRLIGAGVDLTLDTSRLSVADPSISLASLNGTILKTATTAPQITNAGGDGISVTAGNVEIAGININNTGSNGIYFLADNQDWDSATVRSVTTSSNAAGSGVYVNAINGATIDTVSISKSIGNSNLNGFYVSSSGVGTRIENISYTDNTASTNSQKGIMAYAVSSGTIGHVVVQSNTASGQTSVLGKGIHIRTNGAASTIDSVTVSDNLLYSNKVYGVHVEASAGSISDVSITDNKIYSNLNSGIAFDAASGATVDATTIDDNDIYGNSSYGIYTSAIGSITDFNITNNDVHNNISTGVYFISNGGNLDTDVNNNAIRENGGAGLHSLSQSNGDTTIDYANNWIYHNTLNGVQIESSSAGAVVNATSTNNDVTYNSSRGSLIWAKTGSRINFTMDGGTNDNNTSHGIWIEARDAGSGSRIDANISNASFSNNHSHGIVTNGAHTGTILNATFDTLTTNNNTGAGSQGIAMIGAGNNDVTIRNTVANSNGGQGIAAAFTGGNNSVTLENDTTNNATGYGTYLTANAGTLALDITGHTANHTSSYGIFIKKTGSATLSSVSLTSSSFSNNSDDNIRIQIDGATNSLQNLTIDDITTTDSLQRGLIVYTSNGGVITTASLSNITASDNDLYGVHILTGNAAGAGGINSITLDNITATGNTDNGIYFAGQNAGLLSAKLTNSTTTGNLRGVSVDDDTSGTWTVDLGGGALGGTGGNRIYGNTAEDIFVDMDGLQLKARSNWWGQAGGPLGGDVNLNNGTLDSSNALATDPGA